MNNVERKQHGLPYRYDDPALLGDQHIYQDKMTEYNRTLPTQTELRQELLREVFAEVGTGCTVETPLHANMYIWAKEFISTQMSHLWTMNTYTSAIIQ